MKVRISESYAYIIINLIDSKQSKILLMRTSDPTTINIDTSWAKKLLYASLEPLYHPLFYKKNKMINDANKNL